MLPLIPPRLPRVVDRRGSQPDSLSKLMERIQKGQQERRAFRERRGTPRVAVDIEVQATVAGQRLLFRTHDLSTFGLSLVGGPAPEQGTRLALTLALPDDPAPVKLKGQVVGALDEDEASGVRVKFVNPPIEALKRIHRFLK